MSLKNCREKEERDMWGNRRKDDKVELGKFGEERWHRELLPSYGT